MQRGPKIVLQVLCFHRVNPSARPQTTDGRTEMPLSSKKELTQVEVQRMRKARWVPNMTNYCRLRLAVGGMTGTLTALLEALAFA